MKKRLLLFMIVVAALAVAASAAARPVVEIVTAPIKLFRDVAGETAELLLDIGEEVSSFAPKVQKIGRELGIAEFEMLGDVVLGVGDATDVIAEGLYVTEDAAYLVARTAEGVYKIAKTATHLLYYYYQRVPPGGVLSPSPAFIPL